MGEKTCIQNTENKRKEEKVKHAQNERDCNLNELKLKFSHFEME